MACAVTYSIAELWRKEGIAQSVYYVWSKKFMKAGYSYVCLLCTEQRMSNIVLDCVNPKVRCRVTPPFLGSGQTVSLKVLMIIG